MKDVKKIGDWMQVELVIEGHQTWRSQKQINVSQKQIYECQLNIISCWIPNEVHYRVLDVHVF